MDGEVTADDELEIKYVEFSIDLIMRYFVAGFKEKIVGSEWFLDVAKGKVIFKLYVRNKVKV